MKSIVSSLVLVAVLASAGVNAAPATGSEKAVTQKTGSVASKPAVVHGTIANSAKDTEPAGQHPLSSTAKKQTSSKTSTTTSTAQHGSKKDKKRTRKHRKVQGEETGQKTKTKTKSKSKSKERLPASQNTPSASRTEGTASLVKPKSENQHRDVVEAEEALYARGLKSKAQLERMAGIVKKARAKKAKKTKQQGDGDQDTRDLTSDSLSSREIEEALEARFVKKLKQKWRESKANRLQKAATKAQGKADAAATKAGISTEQEARDIFEDEFEARDLADESEVLEARMRRFRKLAKLIPTDEPTDKREVEEDLAAREYFDEELEMREFDDIEDLLVREYFDDDELAARDYEDWEARDVSDEFDLRDFVEIDDLD